MPFPGAGNHKLHTKGMLKSISDLQDKKAVLKEFVKGHPDAQRASYMLRQLDEEMKGRPDDDMAQAFLSLMKIDLDYQIYATAHKESLTALMTKERFFKTKLSKDIMRYFHIASKSADTAVVLFKCKHQGVWVAHNRGGIQRDIHIVIPANKEGMTNIIIQPLITYKENEI